MAETGTKDRASDQAAQTAQNALDVPVQQLKEAGREVVKALMVQTLEKATGRIEGLAHRLNDAADGAGAGTKAAAAGAEAIAQGKSPLKAGVGAGMAGVKEKAKQVIGAGGGDGDGNGGGGDKTKVTTIIEQFDVGLPKRVAYDQWTRFTDYPSFTKKVESVEQESDEKLNWRAQIFLSHRTWESTITEQIPDERIVWRSKAPHGYVDGTVTFHELAPTLTRILLVAEYHPDGFFEKTANLWRAQGRRLRADFKHIKRHMMTQTLLQQDEVEGWRGEIRDGEVVKSHEDALKEEKGEKEDDKEEGDQEATDEKDEKDETQEQDKQEAKSE
ncbi:SRPBCC family protein [Actinomadura syzygii]|uniref:SRPBCC family protein n=1 Tax=Actinomadura syzygii TaxID=1427538 RepID=UPI001CA32621|nr:SRPBCC family protein [Actinomadura syzygii]